MADRKQKRPRIRAVAAGVDNLLNNSVEADKKYVAAELDKNEEIAPLLASMIRDGEIARALERRKTQALTTQVGVKLGPRVKKFRNFSPRMWKELLANLLELETLDDFYPEGFQGEKLTDKQVASFCKFGLLTTDDADVPKDYDASGYEGPLFVVLHCRYVACGCLLAGLNHTNIMDFGWFAMLAEDISKFKCPMLPDLAIPTGYTAEFLQAKTELKIINNHQLDLATLVDEPSGFTQNLKKCLDAYKHDHGLVQTSDSFEYPDAASQFRGMLDPRGSSSAGPATPAAAASAAAATPKAAPKASSPAAGKAASPAAPPVLPAGVPPS